MNKILIPIDLVFIPADSNSSMNLNYNKYVPLLSYPITKEVKPFFKRLKIFNSNYPVVDYYDSDRLIVLNDYTLFVEAKNSGKDWIYASANNEVIKKWKDRNPSMLKEIVSRTGRDAFYNPVYLEDFRKSKVSRPNSIRLDRFRRLMGPVGKNLTGLDIGCNMGYMTHHMARMGFFMTAIDFDKYHLEVADCLTNTYGLSAQLVETHFDTFCPKSNFDVVFALTVLYHIFFRQNKIDPIEASKKVGSFTKSVLFWESGDQPEKEKDLLLNYGGFDSFRTLGLTSGTGIKRELGLFCKNTELSQWLLSRYDELGAEWIIGNTL